MEGMTVFGPERFPLLPNREKVFAWLGCDRDLPCRRAFERAWPTACGLLAWCMRPQAAIARHCDGSLTVFLTLGPEPEAQASALFARQDYVTGSLLNTMSDEVLFQMNQRVAALVSEMLRSQRVYAHARLEPGVDLTTEVQRDKLAAIRSAIPFARISETGVLFPSKSMMYVITVSDEPCMLDTLHDCAACSQTDCPYREAPAAGKSPAPCPEAQAGQGVRGVKAR